MNEQGLLESYADFDRLNADRVRPLVKILVGYVRRGFLFKTGILTPIHLGRAVESVATKEGVTAESDLRWLHENCFGDAERRQMLAKMRGTAISSLRAAMKGR